ncbi:archaeal flagella assembly protein J [Halovivax ruber XH-70]|uniref:Archaeal flagella assembly protein J n=1 Tax=Halovivax ruber (strain DSM 18193 / JCM 13892 / XH-70) TaxID=797302 RepID=L0ICG9_HALRX|nr:type II secretion system F family protein [Halovivax ruber]AGB15911.1 archaeal flagella assembly protein J [Halovivax ruber XH-70]
MSVEGSTASDGKFGDSDMLGDTFYPVYAKLFSEDSQFASDVETKLAQGRMTDTVEMYLSRAIGIGFISGLFLWILGLLVGWGLFGTGIITVDTIIGVPVPNEQVLSVWETIKIPTLIVVCGIVFGSLGFLLGFGSLVAVPYSRASARKREINMLLTDAVSFMYALSVGGLNQLEILQAMAEADDTYGEVSKEFQNVVNETEYFDTDYRTAIRNQAIETPSDELSQFLTDMLSIVNSGGDMESFLQDKKEKHMRTAKQQQELTLETLELFGEMYMTLSLFPLLLIIILVIMQMMPNSSASPNMIFVAVYGLIPLTGVGFIILVSTVKHDEVGDGYLSPDGGHQRLEATQNKGLLDLGLIEQFTGTHSVFDRIKNREGTYETLGVLKEPHFFFREHPLMTLTLTVPMVLVTITAAMVNGLVPTSWGGLVDDPVWGTFMYVYMPVYVILVPLAIFYEWNLRSRNGVVATLSEDLRKLSSANDTGLTLLESLQSVSSTTSGTLAREFEEMHTKVNYGMNLKEAMIEFNNKYHIPRLARSVKLITKAQEASNQISSVLRTAARASENHDDIERDRKSRTRMQVVIIIMTFMTMLAVIAILQTQFLNTMADLGSQSNVDSGSMQGAGGSGMSQMNLTDNINVDQMGLLFFHAITLHAILSGFISGYIRDANLMSGLKYVVGLSTIALVAWAFVS